MTEIVVGSQIVKEFAVALSRAIIPLYESASLETVKHLFMLVWGMSASAGQMPFAVAYDTIKQAFFDAGYGDMFLRIARETLRPYIGQLAPGIGQEQHLCNQCNANATHLCAQCYNTAYCSDRCQKLDWKSHKKQCQ